MRSFIFTFLILSSIGAKAQDYTHSANAQEDNELVDKILVVPFKSQFLLSEIDRGMVNASNMDVMDIRSRLSYNTASSFNDLFGDSINCTALVQEIQEGNLTYIYHGTSYGFKEIKKTDSKKKFTLKKKDEPEAESHTTTVSGGQIVKTPVFKERYMSAEIKSPETLEFIQSEYQASLIIILSELDLMKNKNKENLNEFAYAASLHYSLLDGNGETLEGDKVIKYFNPAEFSLDKMQSEVLGPLCQIIQERSVLYLKKTSDSSQSEDTDKDY